MTQAELFGDLVGDRDYAGRGPSFDPYAIIEAGRLGGRNPHLVGTFQWSLFEDGRRTAPSGCRRDGARNRPASP